MLGRLDRIVSSEAWLGIDFYGNISTSMASSNILVGVCQVVVLCSYQSYLVLSLPPPSQVRSAACCVDNRRYSGRYRWYSGSYTFVVSDLFGCSDTWLAIRAFMELEWIPLSAAADCEWVQVESSPLGKSCAGWERGTTKKWATTQAEGWAAWGQLCGCDLFLENSYLKKPGNLRLIYC